MKKVMILILCSGLFVGICSLQASNIPSLCSNEVLKVASATRNIHVYRISGNITTRKNASYDTDSNTITVDGKTYSVQANPYYGQNDKRGKYQYVAGGSYYFDL